MLSDLQATQINKLAETYWHATIKYSNKSTNSYSEDASHSYSYHVALIGCMQMSSYWGSGTVVGKRISLPGELDALHRPTGESVSGGSSVRSGGDKEIRGRAKLKGTHEVPYQRSDRTPKLVLRNRGKGGKRGKKNFHWPWISSLILGYKGSLRNQSDARVLPTQVTWFDRESLKGAPTLSRSDSKEKDRLQGEMK